MILRAMSTLTLFLTGADHWTTYLCLREPILGWQVSEANPVVELLFDATGLVGGLALDTAFTILAVTFLFRSKQFERSTKQLLLGMIVATTGYAVLNNLQAIADLGISPLGWS